MNEVLRKLFLVIAISSLFSIINSFLPSNADSKDIQGSQIIISTKLKDVSQSDIGRVRKEAEIALNSIPPILGFEFNKKIKIRIVKKGFCRVEWTNNNILLPIWHVRNKIAPIVQLISNVLVMPSQRVYDVDMVYRLGLGVFFQEKFGEDKSFYNYDNIPDLSLYDLVRMHRDNLMPLYWLKYKKGGYWEPEIVKLAYIESGSFISFLYEKYGDQKFKELYKMIHPTDYKKVYGKSIQELEKEWLYYVFVELPAKEPKDASLQRNEISKTFIIVQQSDSIYEYEKVKFKVNSGDVLEVVRSIGCRSENDECWIVHNIETGMRGIINAKRAKSLHQVKTERVSP